MNRFKCGHRRMLGTSMHEGMGHGTRRFTAAWGER
jgi:hypothetical protein